MLAANGDTSAILKPNGKVYVWGWDNYIGNYKNKHRQLPNHRLIKFNEFSDDSVIKSPLNLTNDKIVSLSLGSSHYGALSASGRLYMWGRNEEGQVGDGTTIDRFSPILIPQSSFDDEKIVALSLDWRRSGAITESGKAYMWGIFCNNLINPRSVANRSIPTLVSPSYFENEKVVTFNLGDAHFGVITESNKVYMWGYNEDGRAGQENIRQIPFPTLIPPFRFQR